MYAIARIVNANGIHDVLTGFDRDGRPTWIDAKRATTGAAAVYRDYSDARHCQRALYRLPAQDMPIGPGFTAYDFVVIDVEALTLPPAHSWRPCIASEIDRDIFDARLNYRTKPAARQRLLDDQFA